jgi:hypothetical protein
MLVLKKLRVSGSNAVLKQVRFYSEKVVIRLKKILYLHILFLILTRPLLWLNYVSVLKLPLPLTLSQIAPVE